MVAADEVVVPVDMTDEGALQGAVEVRGIVDRLGRHSEPGPPDAPRSSTAPGVSATQPSIPRARSTPSRSTVVTDPLT